MKFNFKRVLLLVVEFLWYFMNVFAMCFKIMIGALAFCCFVGIVSLTGVIIDPLVFYGFLFCYVCYVGVCLVNFFNNGVCKVFHDE